MLLSVMLLHALYAVSVLGLALYGFQALWLLRHYLRPTSRFSANEAHTTRASIEIWPTVAVHLPIYNERHVAERVIRACTRLKYPAGQLSVRILDDSNDATATLVDRVAKELRTSGHDIAVVRRDGRDGYKAGALDNAMRDETSDFIALFDADFLPPEDFLLRTIPAFLNACSEDVGFVQTRWGHLNRQNSVLTRSQAVALDGHFVVEQDGRQHADFAFGFNGSGGVWRRACIDDEAVGGWQADTLCEDLDLSYRAQLAGWRGLYLGDVESPAEIPPQLLAFKRQQYRWAKGSIQTLRKIGTRVWTSEWSFAKRLAATLHLGAYLLHPMLLILLLIALPLVLSGASPSGLLALLSVTSVGPPLLYATSQRRLYGRDWWRNFVLLPVLMLLGTGLCLSNSIAAVEALLGREGEFLRTPKFEATAGADKWRNSAYRLRLNPIVFGEIILAVYALATATVSAYIGNYWTSVFMVLYAAGFGLVSGYGLWQELTARHALRRHVVSSTTVREKHAQDLWASGASPKS